MQSVLLDELQRSESITPDQKAKLCNSLLNRIRAIQGHTNLNYTEPHFVESKDNIKHTKDMISSIKRVVRRGCSDVLRSAREQARVSSETNSSLTGNENSIKKRQLKSLLRDPDKSADKEEAKVNVKKACNVGDVLFEAAGETRNMITTARLSQPISKESEKGMQIESDIVGEGKSAKKKKRRKRKMDDIEITSSMTIAQSKVNMPQFTQGDSRPVRLKPRKNRDRYLNRKRPECSGDESDIEDASSQTNDKSQARLRCPRRRFRPKYSQMVASSSAMTQQEKEIRDMVSSTIVKLNNVNNHVKRVIEDSLSSEPSFVLETSLIVTPRRVVTSAEGVSVTSNWSAVTMSKSTLVDVSEISKSISLQTQECDKKHSETQATIVSPRVDKEATSSQTAPLPPPTARPDASNAGEEVISPRPKRTKNKSDAPKSEKEMPEVVPAKDAPKKKKSSAIKPVDLAEPVSSMKKNSKKKKDKKKEHVNFVTSPPEVVPDHHPEPPVPLPSKKSVKVISATPDENQKQQRNHPKVPSQENTSPAPVKRSKHKGPRQVSSAKSYRPLCKKELSKVKSTGNLDTLHKETSPVTVRSVLEEEANNSKIRHRSGSRGRRPRSKSGSRDQDRPRSKSGSRIEEGLRPRSVREIYYKIRTNTTNTIANINEQMSSTLKESIAHLNDICGKVRNTLTDMEKDEQTYKRLKSKQSFEVSSEGGGSTISVQTNKAAKENLQGDKTPIKSHTYTVITQPCQDTSIEQLMNTISMGGDNLLSKSNGEIPPATPSKEKKKRKCREAKKRPTSKQHAARPKTLTPTINPSKTKVGTVKKTISCEKTSLAKIPIWQRKPPSVIEEIQLTVKKQATRSQYREFLRALKSIARKQRSQVHVVPQEFREIVEKQQEKAFDSISKHRLAVKKKKDAKPAASPGAIKACSNCVPGQCTCGVTVENTITSSNLQRSNWMHIRSDRKGIQVFDILDEITLKDVEPIQSEYPRKDHISDADASKRVQDTLLYKLLYNEDPKVLELLLKSNCQPVVDHTHVPKVTVVKTHERPKSVSDAYRLYEQLEFNADKKQLELNVDKKPSLNLTPTKGSICLKSSDTPKPTEKPKAVDTCMKDFDDELVIPDDLKPTMKHQVNPVIKRSCKKKYCQIKLKSDDDTSSIRSRKRIEDKMKIIGKKSSIRSIDRRSRKGKYSRENIKTRLKKYNVESKSKIKKILTIMPIEVVQNKDRLKREKKVVDVEKIEGQRDLKISAENMAKINSMSKREIVQILKPYIFYDLQPPVITVMPVSPKYNHQNKHQKQEHNAHLSKAPTLKKVMGFLKDHDDDCHSGKKLCRRCQMFMQSGDETTRTVAKKFEPLTQKQLWKYKYRSTPAENLISRVLGKNTSRKKFQAVPPDESTSNQEVVITMTPRELNRNAANTRSKLNEVKNIMEDHKPLLGQHLDDIIDALEFRIVDALSNPKNQHSDAFSDIESEIKSILSTIGELKEINQEHIKISNLKLKSKTNVDLEDSSEASEMKSKTDINFISSVSKLLEDDASTMRNNEKITPILEEASHVIIQEEESVDEEEESKQKTEDKKLDETYLSLGKDIEKVIDGLDAIMTIDEDTALKEEDTVLKKENPTLKEDLMEEVQMKKNNLSLEGEDAMTTFCEQMDEVMKHLGNTDELNTSTDTLDTSPSGDMKEKKSDEYLTPFMKAVKNYRRNDQSENFLEFLDKLTMLSKEAVSLTIYPRVYRATVKRSAQVVEFSKTYNQAVQCEELITDDFLDVEENFYDAGASAVTLGSHAKEEVPNSDEVLSTNQWMQTEEIQVYVEEFQEVKDCLIQTSLSDMLLREDEYLDTLDDVATSQRTLLISEKNTQIPSCLDHTCFAKNSSKDVQVTSDLFEMTSETVGNQTGGSSEDDLMKTAISAECQIGSDFGDRNFRTAELDDDMTSATNIEDAVATVDMASMEKYTNKIGSCFDDGASEISFDACPRTAYTDSYILRDKNSLLEADLRVCDRPNSYPTTRKSSNIISLFESHNSSNDTNYTRDFLEEGFSKNSDNSYDSMLARCASSKMDAKAPSTDTVEEIPTNQISRSSKQSEYDNIIQVKLVGQKNVEDYRHKNLLHSVYVEVTLVDWDGTKNVNEKFQQQSGSCSNIN